MRGACAAIAVFLIATVIAFTAAQPPAPLAVEADPALVSAGRAHASLARILGDEAPHPVGSVAHARVVERIVDELARIGVEARIEDALVSGWNGVVTRVRNIVGRIEGRSGSQPAIAIACHHDSVAAGPGASDDGAGVAAVIEVVRALKHGPPLEHDLVVLITDGEEVDLSGACAFVKGSPLARDVRAVVNLEARGTSGLAYLFQTGPGVGDAIGRFAELSSKPATSSIAALVYDKLPNDTDLSVFLDAGWTGLNFAFIGGVRRYHTPRDDLEHLDRRSLQHIADGALAGIRAIDTLDLGRPHAERAQLVWHDVLGLFVVRWPRGWSPVLAAAALALLGVAAWRARVRMRELAVGAFALALGVVVTALLTWAFELLQRGFHETNDPWFAEGPPVWSFAALFLGLLGATLSGFIPAVRRATPHALSLGIWSAIAILGLVLAIVEPAACAILVLPAIVASVVSLVLGSQPTARRTLAVVLAAFLGGASIWLPFFRAIEDALGYAAAFVPGAITGLAACALAPVLTRVASRLALTFAVLVTTFFVIAAVQADRTNDTPGWTNATHVQEPEQSRWVVRTFGQLMPTTLSSEDAALVEPKIGSGTNRVIHWFPAPRHAEPSPTAEVVEIERTDARRRVRLTLKSPRGASGFVLTLPADAFEVARIRSDSLELTGEPPTGHILEFAGIGAAGLELELIELRPGPHVASVMDGAHSLPTGLVLPFAPDPTRVPRGDGHGSRVTTRFDL